MTPASENPRSSYPTLFIETTSAKACFELSPQKLKENYLEFHACIMVHSLVDDIDFVVALRTISLDTDESYNLSTFRTSLHAVINNKDREEARHGLLRKLLGNLVCRPEFINLRQDVEDLLEIDLKAAGIHFTPGPNIHAKAMLLAQHIAWACLPRRARSPRKEFCIRLYKLRNCSLDNLTIEVVYLPYDTCFSLFLARLHDMTSFQRAKGGYTLDEGPWQYRLSSAGRNAKEWHRVTDEDSFMQMLGKVKSADGQVSFCHEILRDEINRYEEEKKNDRDNWDWANKAFGDEQGENFFDGSYLDYLANQC